MLPSVAQSAASGGVVRGLGLMSGLRWRSVARNATFTAKRYSSGVARDVHLGAEARREMLQGCIKLADAVGVTLGPKGRNVAIEQPFGPPKITKDGVTVARAIELSNKMHNLGAQLVKHVAVTTNDVAGDGTTTATVLARAIFEKGCEAVAAGMNAMDLLKGINTSVAAVLSYLDKHRKEVITEEDIFNVATISANGDRVIGKLIADAMAKVGKEGTVTIAEGKTLKHELEVVEGLKLDRGYISPHFITNFKNLTVELENAYILMCDSSVSSVKSVLPLLEQIAQNRASLLIVAEEVDSEALATMILNKLRIGLKICAIKSPGFGENKLNQLHDIAALVGAVVITEETGMHLEDVTLDMLGNAKKVVVSKDSTIFLEGGGKRQEVEKRCELIRSVAKAETTTDYEREKLQERLAKLNGGVAILKIGGASEVEMAEVKDRVTDALNATRAAVEEGVVPGGGTALLYAAESVIDLNAAPNIGQRHGMNIVKSACSVPCRLIADNSGHQGTVVVGNLLREGSFGYGFNAQTGTYGDMLKEGILDPTKVVKTALTDASSVASLMATTEAAIVNTKEKSHSNRGDSSSLGMGMGDLDGMY